MYINLLLVEDSADFAQLVTTWLQQYPQIAFDIRRADTLRQALALSESSSVDVILADLNLTDSSGSETAELLLERNPLTPVVILSAIGAEDVMYKTMKSGAQHFIYKPDCNAGVLISTILLAITRQFQSLAMIN